MNKLLLALLLVSSFAYADVYPNKSYTPGKADPALTQSVICGKTFRTTDIRNVSESVKNQVYYRYKVSNHQGYCTGKEGCEIDHLISLELGGSNDASNLWPQPYSGVTNAHDKDKLENKLRVLVCSGQLTLQQAQTAISTDWISAYNKYAK
jgi:hypothetical protein